ncbi:AGAP006165-PB-like protein [Anopheles sinensis]|uniref:AGAP006165-PB-like protein n=1 Tax=Anopheles sinensis TaxID=74873 RepID=A0A084WEP3_ANOSI|nr:AGAP006165-PB-like protein [Anopheles sinensis]
MKAIQREGNVVETRPFLLGLIVEYQTLTTRSSVRGSSGSRTTPVTGTASEAYNASYSSAGADERTGSSETSSASGGTGRGDSGTDGTVPTVCVSDTSVEAAGRSAAGSAISGTTTTVSSGSGASNSSSVVLGNVTLVSTNSIPTSSIAVATVAAAGGGQSTALTSFSATATVATASSASLAVNTAISHKGSASSPTASRKRVKLESAADVDNDFAALKKLILEHKYMRLRNIKEGYSEHVAELFFLQTGGSMMEYPTWRKKPHTPAFTNFIRSYKLEPLSTNLEEAGEALKQVILLEERTVCIEQKFLKLASVLASDHPVSSAGATNFGNSISSGSHVSTVSTSSSKGGRESAASLPQGAEIKIPGVGATPVAVSTTLPAAVAQLSQQGGTPIIPDRLGIGATATSTTTTTPTPVDRKNYPLPQPERSDPWPRANWMRSAAATVVCGVELASLLLVLRHREFMRRTRTAGGSRQQCRRTVGDKYQRTGPVHQQGTQEVFVMQRVQELQKEGLWTEKRLPKVQEPARPKAHWDYLLEEMVWLAADFAQERKWKKACARKCARMVQKHFQDKALAAQRAEKAQELQLKRIAAFVAKEIKTFWSNAEKLVEYKQQTKLDEKRKKALDQQLSFIVDQTEKYSQQLVEGMNKVPVVPTAAAATGPSGSKAESLNSSRISSPHRGLAATGSDEEFCPEAESSGDDEETIAKAEAEAEEGTKDEVAALQKESEMDLDDFLKNLPKDYLQNRDKIVLSEPDDEEEEDDDDGGGKSGSNEEEEEDGDKDFSADEDSMDDEDTIKEQERKEKHQDHKKEIDELNADNEMSIEELMAKYNKPPPPSSGSKMDLDSDDDEVKEEDEESHTDRKRRKTRKQSAAVESPSASEEDGEDNSEGLTGSDDEMPSIDDEEELDDDEAMDTEEEDDGIGLKHLLDDETVSSLGATGATSSSAAGGGSAASSSSPEKSQSAKDDMLNDAAAIAESIQPKGNTLSSTSVVTPIPILLKHSLREYQHIGLDWLVTMHDRKLNGILADEMGLGKTIQTISLLAHLACVKGNWGPHLIIVPSSVMLNWEMEFKKWCPGFKILTYYGTPKERKLKRTGWTKVNAFHVCITSYKLVIQDHQSFRRKKWNYLILDEAQNIKNFRSQRWQLLLNFQTEQRLLLTGTPLQNNLMELWSLMHFLMPHIFQSHREFKEWFSNPMTGMIEGNSEYSETIIKRLHKVLRPFLLRRLKSEVEKQMPKKYEHVIMCRLSKRQRFLYDDFMSRAKTRETLASGNLLSVINVLMQLRKVCNHPNMFEERPTISPFRMDGISFKTASLVYNMFNYDPFTQIDLSSLNLVLVQLELVLSAYVAHRSQRLCMPKRLIEEIDSTPLPPPRCPTGKLRLHVRIPDFRVQESLGGGVRRPGVGSTGVRVGTSPAMKTDGTKFVPLVNDASLLDKKSLSLNSSSSSRLIDVRGRTPSMMMMVDPSSTTTTGVGGINSSRSASPALLLRKRDIGGSNSMLTTTSTMNSPQQNRLSTGGQSLLTATTGGTSVSNRMVQNVGQQTQISSTLAATIMQQLKNHSSSTARTTLGGGVGTRTAGGGSRALNSTSIDAEERQRTEFYLARIEESRKERRSQVLELLGRINAKRLDATPIYGQDLRETLCEMIEEEFDQRSAELIPLGVASAYHMRRATRRRTGSIVDVASCSLMAAIKTIEQRAEELRYTISNFVIFVPAVCAPTPYLQVSHPHPSKLNAEQQWEMTMAEQIRPAIGLLHPIISAMSTQFPDPRLIQYDCGKLQTLDRLLKKLKSEGHRVLIFTQMTRMLDVLEAFLNYHGHIYLRLDGTTKVEQRQVLMERFNNDRRMFAFILSTRSGGVGINLTGADTVIFYDSDWNPTMDAQAQDRCHRIGQTRDVHIYRLVSEKTIEENILKKANQKRILGDLAIEGGNFTTAYFKSSTTIQDLFTVDAVEENASARLAEVLERDRERKDRLNANLSAAAAAAATTTAAAASSSSSATTTVAVVDAESSKSAINVFESALAAAEDDQDVQAAKFAKAEASAGFDDLDEIDENNSPAADEGEKTAASVSGAGTEVATVSKQPELSKAEKEVQNLIKQLSPIERYAMRFVEDTEGTWTAVQLKAVEQEIEQQKRDWEANRLAEQRRNEEAARQREAEEHADLLTFSREDAKNQVNNKTHPSNRGSSGGGGRKKLRPGNRASPTTSRSKARATGATIGGHKGRRGVDALGKKGDDPSGRSDRRRTEKGTHRLMKGGGGNVRASVAKRRPGTSNDRNLPAPPSKGAQNFVAPGLDGVKRTTGGSLLGKRKHPQPVSAAQAAAAAAGGGRRRNLRPTARPERRRTVMEVEAPTRGRGAKRPRTEDEGARRRRVPGEEQESEEEKEEEDDEDNHTDVDDKDNDEDEDDVQEEEEVEEDGQSSSEDGNESELDAEDDEEGSTKEVDEEEEHNGQQVATDTASSSAQRRKSVALNAVSTTSRKPAAGSKPSLMNPTVARRSSEATKVSAASVHALPKQQVSIAASSLKHTRPKLIRRGGVRQGPPKATAAAGSSGTTSNSGAGDGGGSSVGFTDSEQRTTTNEPSMAMRVLDEFDSECSLDVMIDSNDAPDSDSNQMNSYYTSNSSVGGAAASKEHDDDANVLGDGQPTTPHAADRQLSRPTSRGGRSRDSRSKTPIAAAGEDHSGGDQSGNPTAATPRTRSRGTVKINLWTLDDSPMLPVYKRTKTKSTPSPQLPLHHQNVGNHHNDSDTRSLDGEADASDMAQDPLMQDSTMEEEDDTDAEKRKVPTENNKSATGGPPPSDGSSTSSNELVRVNATQISLLKDLKVIVNDFNKLPSAAQTSAVRSATADGRKNVSDGFRTPTPTVPKLRRLNRLSLGRSVSPANNRATRTLDTWLVSSKPEEGKSKDKDPAIQNTPKGELHGPMTTTGSVKSKPTTVGDHDDTVENGQT